MVNKIAYTENGKIIIRSYDLRKDPQIYIDSFVNKGFTDAVVIDYDNLPNSEYRDAWEISGNSVIINVTTAKQKKKDKLVEKKENEKKSLEKLFTEAKSKNKDTTGIETRIAYLESLPKESAIDAATDIEALEAIDFDSWSEPVIDNLGEDKSKIPIMFYNNSETDSSTTNENEYTQKNRLTFTSNSTTYFIWYYAEVYTSSKRKKVSTRVEIDDTTTIHEASIIPSAQDLGWSAVSGEYIHTFTEGSHTIDFDFKANGASVTMRRCRIMVTEIVSGN